MLHLAILGNAGNYHWRRWLPPLISRGVRISLLSFAEPTNGLHGVEFHRLKRPTRFFGQPALADFLLATASTRKLLKEIAPDVLMGSYATNYGFLGARTGVRPFALQTWTADIQLYPHVGLRRFVLGPMVRHALRKADLVTTDGPTLREVLIASFPFCSKKTESILWGIELDDFLNLSSRRSQARRALDIPEDAIVITSARGLRLHDRPEISLYALLDILGTREDVHAVVVTLGHHPAAEIASVLDLLRAYPRCHIVDQFLDRHEINDIWAASDFVVSIPLFDGISETLLEAMAAGCIPILSDIAPNRAIVPDGENAIFSSAESAGSLATDIRKGLDAIVRFKESAVPANQAWVRENASIDRAADRLTTLLTELAGGK